MKARVLTGLIGGPLAIVVLLFSPAWLMRVLMALVCVVAMYELLKTVSCKHQGLSILALLFAAIGPFANIGGTFSVALVVALYMLLLATLQTVCHRKLAFSQTALICGLSILVILPLAMLGWMYALPTHGRAYVFLTMIIAWFSDIGAYFTGTFFGKHKLCPRISPKKTVEGVLGGVVTSVLISLLGAWIYQLAVLDAAGLHVVYWQVALVAFVFVPVTILGDLFCSVIKRQYGIKDFGNVFPGHGGMLDRFDSLIFAAPLLYLLYTVMPMVV